MRWRELPLGSVCAIFDGPHATVPGEGHPPLCKHPIFWAVAAVFVVLNVAFW